MAAAPGQRWVLIKKKVPIVFVIGAKAENSGCIANTAHKQTRQRQCPVGPSRAGMALHWRESYSVMASTSSQQFFTEEQCQIDSLQIVHRTYETGQQVARKLQFRS